MLHDHTELIEPWIGLRADAGRVRTRAVASACLTGTLQAITSTHSFEIITGIATAQFLPIFSSMFNTILCRPGRAA